MIALTINLSFNMDLRPCQCCPVATRAFGNLQRFLLKTFKIVIKKRIHELYHQNNLTINMNALIYGTKR